MLQTFARESRAPPCAAHQEALATRVRERPDQIADALEAEHRIVSEERDHRNAVRRVGCSSRRERSHGARLGDSFFENLAVLGFLVIEKILAVDRLIELA